MATAAKLAPSPNRADKHREKTYRVLSDGNPDLNPVVVGFSRPVNKYERLAWKDFRVISGESDRIWTLIRDTTIDAIRDHIDEYNAKLDAAVEKDWPVCPLEYRQSSRDD